jgi:hypothetical protein
METGEGKEGEGGRIGWSEFLLETLQCALSWGSFLADAYLNDVE